MYSRVFIVVILFCCMSWSQAAIAAELSIKSGDSIQKVLEEHKGKRVTVRMHGNDELTGKVRTVTKDLLHLGELTGRDFFDAILEVSRISVVIVRVKE